MTEQKKELQEKYESLAGKKAFGGWDEKTLKVKIAELERNDEDDDVKIDPNKTYVFKLLGDYSPVKYFPNEAEVYHKGKIRKIRNANTEDSPYVDEQDDNAKPSSKPIVFTNGRFEVQGTQANIVRYLLASDSIKGKDKVLPKNIVIKDMFELEDRSAIIKSKLQKEEDEFEARKLVKNSKVDDLRNYLRSVYLVGVDVLEDDEIILEATNRIKEDAKEWLRDFQNPKHKIKADIQKLFAKGELDDTGNTVKWKKTGGVILNYDDKSGVRSDDILTKFVIAGGKEADDFKKVMATKLA